MEDHYKKAERAAEEGAHVAAILYKVLCLENVEGMDYRQDWERSAVESLVEYRSNLKKETDQKALDEFLATNFRGALDRSGYGVDITATIRDRPKPERVETTGDILSEIS